MLYRYSHNSLEAWKVLDLHPKRQSRPPDIGRMELVPLYTSAGCLQSNKVKVLKAVLQYIPPVHHMFYNSLLNGDSSPESTDEVDDEVFFFLFF